MSGRGPPPHLSGPGSPRSPRRDRDRRYDRYEDSPRGSDGASPRRDRVRDRSRSPRRDRYDDRDRTRGQDRGDRYERYDRDRRDDRDYRARDRDRRDYDDDDRRDRERPRERERERERERDVPRSRGRTADQEDVKPVIKTESVQRGDSRGPPAPDGGSYANGGRGGYAGRGGAYRGRGGYGGQSNGREEYDRPLDRRAIEEGRRRREEERARGVVYTEEGKYDPSEQNTPQDSNTPRRANGDEDMDEDDEAASMAAMMGFGGFGTTKGKGVDDNVEGGAKVHKQRTWRQYMNRRGGFNRPLEKIT